MLRQIHTDSMGSGLGTAIPRARFQKAKAKRCFRSIRTCHLQRHPTYHPTPRKTTFSSPLQRQARAPRTSDTRPAYRVPDNSCRDRPTSAISSPRRHPSSSSISSASNNCPGCRSSRSPRASKSSTTTSRFLNTSTWRRTWPRDAKITLIPRWR